MAKYPLVREQLRAGGLLDATTELVPEEAAHDDLARVHTAGYLAHLFGEGLTAAEVRALVIDLDVHQGNGTAAIFEGDDSVFTFSMHGERNYPARKMRSTLDVGLPDGTDDAAYLGALAAQLPRLTEGFRPELVFYLAGVDVAAGDRYGRFALSDAGLRERERQVLGWARAQGLPLTVTLAGGYAATPARTAALHAMVFEEAAA